MKYLVRMGAKKDVVFYRKKYRLLHITYWRSHNTCYMTCDASKSLNEGSSFISYRKRLVRIPIHADELYFQLKCMDTIKRYDEPSFCLRKQALY